MRIKLQSLDELEAAFKKMGPNMSRGMRAIARKAAVYGVARGVLRSRAAGIRATGAYDAGFVHAQTTDGAIIANASEHAIFVERGRRPGRMPPVMAILKWLIAKGLVTMKAPSRREIAGLGGAMPVGEVSGAKQRARMRIIRRKRAPGLKAQAGMRFALAVARAIGRRGTPGRFIMKGVAGDVSVFVKRELRKMARALAGR